MKFLETIVYGMTVQFEDVDAGGYVHHPNYLKFAERGRYQALRDIGFGFERQLDDGFIFVVAEMGLKYIRPLRMGDEAFVLTRLVAARRSSVKVYQTILAEKPSAEVLQQAADGIFDFPGAVFHAQMRFVYFDLRSSKPVEIPVPARSVLGIPGADYFRAHPERQNVTLFGF